MSESVSESVTRGGNYFNNVYFLIWSSSGIDLTLLATQHGEKNTIKNNGMTTDSLSRLSEPVD